MKGAFRLILIAAALALAFFFALRFSRGAEKMAGVTFAKDVAPIIQKNCVVCHRPGEVAPMSFMNYKEVRPWAKAIREKVVTRAMPPWFADPSHGEFSNDPRLSQKDIDTVAAWVEGGAKEGDSSELPPNPKYRTNISPSRPISPTTSTCSSPRFDRAIAGSCIT
jgi:mono/diheme cytochrome c family protein